MKIFNSLVEIIIEVCVSLSLGLMFSHKTKDQDESYELFF